MHYNKWIFKRNFEQLLLLPFIIIGRLLHRMFDNINQSYDCYFFFPFYHTGGAEFVHAQITSVLKNRIKGKVYFTRRSQNQQFKSLFEASGWEIQDISKFTDHKLWYFCNLIMRGFLSNKINGDRQVKFVFNGQSNFGYKISPWIKKSIQQIELIHSYNSFSFIRIPYIEYYDKTVMIASSRIQDHFRQYDRIKVPQKFYSRIELIQNGIKIPENIPESDNQHSTLKVLYVGRAGKEKRVHLIFEIAKQFNKESVEFGFVGDLSDQIQKNMYDNIKLFGNISDEKKLKEIYQSYDILILTSSTEGMPIVVQEAMANGLAIIATPVGDIPFEVENWVNGFVVTSSEDESLVVKESIEYISILNQDRSLLKKIIENNKKIAKEKYGMATFQKKYERLFNLSPTN